MAHNHHNHMDMNMNMETTTIISPSSSSNGINNSLVSQSSNNYKGMTDDSSSSMMSQMMMAMHFGFSEIIVFPQWATKDRSSFVGSCFALLLIGIIYEALKCLRINFARIRLSKKLKLNRINKQKGSYNVSLHDKEQTNQSVTPNLNNESDQILTKTKKTYFKTLFSIEHIVNTVFHFIQHMISFFLMLAFMTYNYWICLCILIGITIGFFFFGVNRSSKSFLEDCCD